MCLLSWAKKDKRDLTISYFMDGIFSNGKNIADTDPYYKDYVRFMGIVNYSRPAGEYFPKLTLLETMGVIVTEARQYDYLQRILPPYQRTLPKEYRVEIKMTTRCLNYFDVARQPPAGVAFSSSWTPPTSQLLEDLGADHGQAAHGTRSRTTIGGMVFLARARTVVVNSGESSVEASPKPLRSKRDRLFIARP
jgi:hypothetical protein